MSGNYRIDRLNEYNYTTWKVQMEAILDLLGYLPAIKTPNTLTEDQKKADIGSKARSQILLHLSPSILESVQHQATAVEVWNALKEEYVSSSISNQNQLRQELSNAKMDSKEGVAGYFARMIRIRNSLSAAGDTLSDGHFKSFVFNGLPKQYGGYGTGGLVKVVVRLLS